jgi:hypothetical protein
MRYRAICAATAKEKLEKIPPGSSTASDSLPAASYASGQRLENNFVLGAGIYFGERMSA